MGMVCGLDLHRQQITFDAWRRSRARCGGAGCGSLTGNGSGAGSLATLLDAATGSRCRWWWRAAPGGGTWSRRSSAPASRRTWRSRPIRRRLAGRKRHAKTDRSDARMLRELLQSGDLPESWIPPTDVLEWRERVRVYKSLVDQRRCGSSGSTPSCSSTASPCPRGRFARREPGTGCWATTWT
jgi:hypothetical protein